MYSRTKVREDAWLQAAHSQPCSQVHVFRAMRCILASEAGNGLGPQGLAPLARGCIGVGRSPRVVAGRGKRLPRLHLPQ